MPFVYTAIVRSTMAQMEQEMTALTRDVSNSNKKHQDNKRAYVANTIIPNSWHDPTVQAEKSEIFKLREVDCSLPYGAAPNIHSISTCKSLMEPKK